MNPIHDIHRRAAEEWYPVESLDHPKLSQHLANHFPQPPDGWEKEIIRNIIKADLCRCICVGCEDKAITIIRAAYSGKGVE